MLEFKDVTVSRGKKPIVRNISFKLRPHSITAVIGRNGCGKSTLFSAVAGGGIYTGQILFDDRDIRTMTDMERARAVSVLPQFLPEPDVTVRELVSFGRTPYLDFAGRLTEKDKESVSEAMKLLDIESLAEKSAAHISGGEKQKAYLAMTLAQNTRVLLLDEPTTYMDQPFQNEFMNILTELKSKRKKTFLTVLHDLPSALKYADDIAVIADGELKFFGSAEECGNSSVIEEVFGTKKHIFTENGKKYYIFE